MAETETYRLPRTVQPRHYALELRPDLSRNEFEGSVRVTLEVLETTRALVLNAADLVIFDAELELPEGRRLPGSVSYNQHEQQATVAFAEEVPAGSGYVLRLDYLGRLNDQLHGFYRSTYRDENAVERVIASTQFEPADARRAFPCWDEPEFKATFTISLVVGEGETALSNEGVAAEEDLGDGRRRITFEETMIMSTYLVAVVVGPFEFSETRLVGGTPVRVAAVVGRSHLTGFALESAASALRFLATYFDIPYPGRKLDHIAIPDFAWGAMENLGCVTYRESALLADPAVASQVELQRIATVIAHETAHMWFGDLVTMKWWNGIWLNEAFATFMELTTTNADHPEWHVWTAFGVAKAAALSTDGLRATRPVEYRVGRPEEAEAMFDVLTYQKGGAVLRMLEQYIGPETFRKGISHYLETHSYGNTETTDLWDALETVSGEPVTTIMDSWIYQRGYPVIVVERGADPATIELRQRRFLYDGAGSGERWSVPINLRAWGGGRVQHQKLLLDTETASFSFEGPVDWVVVNDGAWGFYRVRYSSDLGRSLRQADLKEVLSPAERLSLVGDTWAAVVAGLTDLDEWVSVAEALVGDTDPDVWSAIGSVLELLDLVAGDEDREPLRALVQRVASQSWSELGWTARPGEARRAATARARVLAILGLTGEDPEIRPEAHERFDRFLGDRSALQADLVSSAARIAVSAGGEDGWETVLDKYKTAATPQERIRYLFALAESADPSILTRTLDLALSPDVRVQDAPFLIADVMSRRDGTQLAWDWIEARWDDIRSRIPGSLMARLLEGIASVVEADLAARVHSFCAAHDMAIAGPRLDQLLERMDINVALARRLRGTYAGTLGA